MKPLGILMLDTRFPRIKGDIGNAASFDFPVIFQRLEGIGPSDAVAAHPDKPRVMKALAANARKLAEAGAVGISTSCGFLALFQQELASVSPVPVATSALMLIPTLTERKVGVITASARNLTPAHLIAVGAAADTPVEGMPEGGAFAATFLENGLTLDPGAVEAEAVAAGRSLLAKHPQVDAIVFECTNLPPYSAALKRAGIAASDIDYINAHGTSTQIGDEIELGAAERLLGNAASKVSMSSTKSSTGHLLGAAGAIEAIFGILAIRDNIVPPTINLDNPSVETSIDLVPRTPRKREVNTVLSNSFGFGGTNASVVMQRVVG